MPPKTSYISMSDYFCGAGGSSTGAAAVPGVEVTFAANHWKLAIETHATNHPNTQHDTSDLQEVHPSMFPGSTIAWFSPECFPADTLILSKRGLIPIQDILVGDEVLTHKNRWMPVTSVMGTIKDTMIVAGQGHRRFEVTAEHPIYTRSQYRVWDNTIRRRVKQFESPEWVTASNLKGSTGQNWGSTDFHAHRWATPTCVSNLEIPDVGSRGMDTNDVEFWWLVGRWLGDGSLRLRLNERDVVDTVAANNRPYPSPCLNCGKPAAANERYPHIANFYCDECYSLAGSGSEIHVACGRHEIDYLWERLQYWQPENARAGYAELRWRKHETRTAYVLEAGHSGLAEWLLAQFGQHAYGKTIPSWALGMPLAFRKALLEGYVSADGHISNRSTTISTVSKNLAIGIRLLAESLGYRATLNVYEPHNHTIEGRNVNVRPSWVVRWENNKSQREAFEEDGMSWGLIKSTREGHKQVTVYNLSVAEDESYVADGIVVHNCTNHTVAKGRKRIGVNQLDLWGETGATEAEIRSRATMREVVEFTEYHRYEAVIVENVSEIRLWDAFGDWLQAMINLGYAYKEVFFNSMFAHPTPQSRDRIYVVFWKQGNKAPDLNIRPSAYCSKCEAGIESVFSPKSHKLPGRVLYGKSYVYRCPKCASIVEPYYYAAFNAIDWSLPVERIGDRKKPLAENTIKRIQRGLDKYKGKWMFLDMSRPKLPGRIWSADHPLNAITTKENHGVVMPFLATYYSGDDNCRANAVDEAIRAVTTENRHALVMPSAFISTFRFENAAKGLDEPMPTATTAIHEGLILPQGFTYAAREFDSGRGLDEAMKTVIATANQHALIMPQPMISTLRGPHTGESPDKALTSIVGTVQQALVTPHNFISTFYNNGGEFPVSEASPAMTSRQHHALINPEPSWDIEDAGFRMLQPHEIKIAMGFPKEYVILGNKAEQVKQAGNAVTSPVATLLVQRVVDSLQ